MAIDLSGGIDIQREYVCATCPEVDGTRDAVNVWLENRDAALAMRIGIEALSPQWDTHEYWLDIAFADGRVISGRAFGKTHPAIGANGLPVIRSAGPIRFECVTPFRTWTVAFRGKEPQITTMDLIGARIMDEDTRKYNLRREGIISNAMGFMNRLNGLFTSTAFYLVAILFGFESGLNPGTHPDQAARFLLAVFPPLLMVLSLLFSIFINFDQPVNESTPAMSVTGDD